MTVIYAPLYSIMYVQLLYVVIKVKCLWHIPVPHLSTLFISEAHAVNTFKSVGMLLRWHTGKQELLTFASIQQPVKNMAESDLLYHEPRSIILKIIKSICIYQHWLITTVQYLSKFLIHLSTFKLNFK